MDKRKIAYAFAIIVIIVAGTLLLVGPKANASQLPNDERRFVTVSRTRMPMLINAPAKQLIRLGRLECKLLRQGYVSKQIVNHAGNRMAQAVTRATLPGAKMYLCPDFKQ